MRFRNSHFSMNQIICTGLSVFLTLSIIGCGDSNHSKSRAFVDPELQSWLDELNEGTSVLNISGAVSAGGEYTTAIDPRYGGVSRDVYRPAIGGGASRSGSNAEGPYSLTIYTDAIHQDEPDNTVRAWVNLILPSGAVAGKSYQIASFSTANEHQVQAHLRGDGHAWTFDQQVEGELHLLELGGKLTAAWRFSAADGNRDDAAKVLVQGAARDIAFVGQPEAHYKLTINGETQTHLGRVAINHGNNGAILTIGNRISLMLPKDISNGEYALASRASEQTLRVILSRYDVDSITGVLHLVERGELFDADIRFETSGADHVVLEGRLEQLTLIAE
ncbi:hypothetical protein QWY20_13625 [Alkalimonas sp. MEB108]|uniref:Lipoprotein n=1 Tax=Alkalimonas cellulosilytica TaxID=3058395 RepID=A0ABU7J8Z9_9GAMM|nr:hypothetical protein [Alkalimonas sp. MEB108]MEE2002497.1 hypothetical protein [Alkalimonas sp. MEB108]